MRPNSDFSKLGLFEKLRTRSINRDYKTQERAKDIIPKKERDETSLNEEPVKPSNSKTQEKMHTDSVFNELGLVEELATSSRTSHREIPRSNNK